MSKSIYLKIFCALIVLVGAWSLSLSNATVRFEISMRALTPSIGDPRIHSNWGEDLKLQRIYQPERSKLMEELEILPIANSNPKTKGAEVWIFDFDLKEDKGQVFHQLPQGWEWRPDGRASEKNAILHDGKHQPVQPLRANIPRHGSAISVLRHPWSGAVGLSWPNQTQQVIDLYSDSAEQSWIYLEGKHIFEASGSLFYLIFNRFSLKDAAWQFDSIRMANGTNISVSTTSFSLIKDSIYILFRAISLFFGVLGAFLFADCLSRHRRKVARALTALGISAIAIYLLCIVAQSPWISDDYSNYGIKINLSDPRHNRYPAFILFLFFFLRPSTFPSIFLHSITGIIWILSSATWASFVMRLVAKRWHTFANTAFLATFLVLNPIYSQTYLWTTASYPLWIMFFGGIAAISFVEWSTSRHPLKFLFWIISAGLASFFGEHGVMLCFTIPLLVCVYGANFQFSILKDLIRGLSHGIFALLPYLIFRLFTGIIYKSWIGVQPYKTDISLRRMQDLAITHIGSMTQEWGIKILILTNAFLVAWYIGRAIKSLLQKKIKLGRCCPKIVVARLLQIIIPYGFFLAALIPYLSIGGWWTNHYYFIPAVFLTIALMFPLVGYLANYRAGLDQSPHGHRALLIGRSLVFISVLIQFSAFEENTISRIPSLANYVNNFIHSLENVSFYRNDDRKEGLIFIILEPSTRCPQGLFGGNCGLVFENSWVLPGLKNLKKIGSDKITYFVSLAARDESRIVLNSYSWLISQEQFLELSNYRQKFMFPKIFLFDSFAVMEEIKGQVVELHSGNGASLEWIAQD